MIIQRAVLQLVLTSASGFSFAFGGRSLSQMAMAIALGLVLGSWASGWSGWFLWFTRAYRQARRLLVIALGYLVVIGSTLGSLWLMREVSERMGFGRNALGNAARFAWAAGFVGVGAFVIASEVKWQRSLKGGKNVPPRS